MIRRYAITGMMICALLTTQTLSQPATLYAAANPESLSQTTGDTYVNPSYDEINQMIEEVAKEKAIPSIILKAIAFKESSWRQFDKEGNPLFSRPEHPAIGIMQVATYNDNDLETIHKLKTDIMFNLRMGAELLDEKWRFTPTIGDGDRNKLENWYFALWAYNIWTDKNNPNTLAATSPDTLTYQEKIFNVLAHPEGFLARYIDPVEVTPIPAELLPAAGIPLKTDSWMTPEPIHYGDLNSADTPGGEPTDPGDPNEPKNPDDPNNSNNPVDTQDPPYEEEVPDPPQTPVALELIRLAGKDRIDTAIEQALKGWPDGAGTVVLARADHFPDALAGAPLAAQYDAPILLTSSQALEARVAEAIMALGPEKVILLGGEGALSQKISAKLEDLGWDSERQIRVSGLNRYETAANIALATSGTAESPSAGSIEAVALATGQNFPDALSIASVAGIKQMPILLTEAKTLPRETLEALKDLNPQKVYLIGGEGAISLSIQDTIQEQLSLPSSQLVRLYGDSRYDTMAAVAEAFAGESQGLCFATGQEFPDALAGAALAARLNATVILLPKSSIEDYPRLKNAIAQYPCNFETQPYIFGGEGAVSPEQVAELKELLENTYVAVNLTD